MSRKDRTKATDISPKVRQEIHRRDYACIFCQRGYKMDDEMGGALQIMHYVPRSQGGMGIKENLALGCPKHHRMLDNSPERAVMKKIFKAYLKRIYPWWDEKNLVYDKWRFFDE